MTALPYLSVIQFSGADAAEFLHNQLSADVLALSSHESTFACYCEPKGRVLALMLVSRIDDDIFVALSSELAESISIRLKMYVLRAKVEITVLQENTVAGLLEGVTTEPEDSMMFKIPVPGSNQWLAVLNVETALDTSNELSDTWKMSELKRGVTWLNSKTTGQFLPQMLGFDQIGAVNFRKGCYPGQEIVARTHYLGKVKRHARVISIRDEVQIAALEKIQLLAKEQQYEAVVVDTGFSKSEGGRVFVVTRLTPEVEIEAIEIDGVQSETAESSI